jgi:hypothetical protein
VEYIEAASSSSEWYLLALSGTPYHQRFRLLKLQFIGHILSTTSSKKHSQTIPRQYLKFAETMASRERFIETFPRVDATQEQVRTWLASWFTVRDRRYSPHFLPLQIVLGNGHASGKEQDMIHIPSSSSRMLVSRINADADFSPVAISPLAADECLRGILEWCTWTGETFHQLITSLLLFRC